MKFDKSLVSGSTPLLLLKLLGERDMYGYEMIDELDRRSQNVFALKAGTLYPVLHALQAQGLIESYEQTAQTGRERIYYRITAKGQAHFAQKAAEWSEYTSLIGGLLGGARYAL